MKRNILVLLLAFIVFASLAQESSPITTFVLVRHGEKASNGSDDPELKPEGQERAKRLAAMFANGDINAVYSTKYKRTKNTVTPLAQAKGLDVQVYESLKVETLSELIAKHKGGTIVIAGHSNTVPQIANTLLGKETFQNFTDTEYGNVLIISLDKVGSGKVLRLQY